MDARLRPRALNERSSTTVQCAHVPAAQGGREPITREAPLSSLTLRISFVLAINHHALTHTVSACSIVNAGPATPYSSLSLARYCSLLPVQFDPQLSRPNRPGPPRL